MNLREWWSEYKCPSEAPGLEHLVPSWWCCLRRFRNCGLDRGGMSSLGVGYERPKTPGVLVFRLLSLVPVCVSRWELSRSCACLLSDLPTRKDSCPLGPSAKQTAPPVGPLVMVFYYSKRKDTETETSLECTRPVSDEERKGHREERATLLTEDPKCLSK